MKNLVFMFLAFFSFSTVVFAQEEYSPQSRCVAKNSICLGMTFDEINKSVPKADRFSTLSSLKTEKMRGFDVGLKSYFFFDDSASKSSVSLGLLDGVVFKIIVFNDENKEVLNLTDEEIHRDLEARAAQSLIER